MNVPLRSAYRLVTRGEAGLSCDKDGLALGAVDLARVRLQVGGVRRCEVRSRDEVGQVLRVAYGRQTDGVIRRIHGGLCRAATWIETGDIGRAGVEAVRLSLPGLTLEGVAKLCEIADIEKRNTAWETEPRIPPGQPGGGQWTTTGDDAPSADVRPIFAAPPEGPQHARVANQLPPCDVSSATDASASGIAGGFGGADRARLISVSTAAVAVGGASAVGDVTLPPMVARLGQVGLLAFGASLLDRADADLAREQIAKAIARFGLDPSRPADVMAASAYVWSRYNLPFMTEAPFNGPPLDAASQAVMRLVMVRPGAFVTMRQGSKPALDLITLAAKSGLADYAVESRARPPGVEPALQTTSQSARSALNLLRNDRMRAHHLVPAGIWKLNIAIARLAFQDGWRPDNPSNLIALPADVETQQALDDKLPVHNDFHPIYDKDTQALINAERSAFPSKLTPLQAHSILDDVAIENRGLLFSGKYHPFLRIGA